jgi:hypothetical protein
LSLLLRAIVAAGDAEVATTTELRVVLARRVAALVSPWADAERTAGEGELLDHHRIVQGIFERAACLPGRFGSVFADETTLHTRLVAREAELVSQLARLGHRCELAITCAWLIAGGEPPATPLGVPASSGRTWSAALSGPGCKGPGRPVRRRSLPAYSASWRSSRTRVSTGLALDRRWPFQCPPW